MEAYARNPSEIERVTSEIMRQRFNDGQFFERLTSGDLRGRVRRSKHRNPPPAGAPVCTHSQVFVDFTKDGKPVAIVHQYLRVNGKLGASGRPDPKWLVVDNRILAVRST